MEYLSNIELYYSSPDNFSEEEIILTGDDFHHAVKVMRNNEGDTIYVTSGKGKIYKCLIKKIFKDRLTLSEVQQYSYENKFKNIYFCLPKLKSQDRFEFALEKCVELGVTNFLIFNAERNIAKGNKIDRWTKILTSAMKQSLRSYLPEIKLLNSTSDLISLQGKKFVLEQNAENNIKEVMLDYDANNYFIFGPEGGLSGSEISLFQESKLFKLADNRLRSETAIIMCASLLH